MKILVFYPYGAIGAAWNVSGGLVSTLQSMGHDARTVKIPVLSPADARLTPASVINENYDLAIFSGIEHVHTLLEQTYGRFLKDISIPRFALYHESMQREDRHFYYDVRMADKHFFPAVQDAKRLNGEWLPFGVDTTIFKPRDAEKEFNAGFVGNVYGTRAAWLQRKGLNLQIASAVACNHPDTDRLDEESSTLMLAREYRKYRVFVNLPALSQLLVTKVYEVAACGTFIITPLLTGDAADNMVPMPAVYYNDRLTGAALNREIQEYLHDETWRESFAKKLCEYVHKNHSLQSRMETLLGALK